MILKKRIVCILSRIILVFDGQKKDVKYKIHYIKDFFEDFSAKMASQCIIFHLSSVIPKVIQRFIMRRECKAKRFANGTRFDVDFI